MPRLVFIAPWVFTCALASAQAAPIDDLRPAVDSRGYLTLNGSSVLGHEELSFGLGSLEWGRHPSRSVDDMVSATLVAAMGLQLGVVSLELGASLPFTISSGEAATQGVGEAGLHLKVHVASHLALIGSAYLLTGARAHGVTPQALAVADTRIGRWGLAVSGGVRLAAGMDDMASRAGTLASLPFGGALAYAVVPEKLELVGEVYGAMQPRDTGVHQLEALVGVKLYLAKSSYLSLGAGRGLVTEPGNPDLRALIGIVFEPKAGQRAQAYVPEPDATPPAQRVAQLDFPDRDNDGIRDELDACPDDPETYNGFQDEDGCPDTLAEPPAPVPDATPGCTKAHSSDAMDCPNTVIVRDGTIDTLRSIEFEFDKAVIAQRSLLVLDKVVRALVDNPEIDLVEVQGHTDERGDDEYNLDLSNRRATAVVTYLVSKGIAAHRLTGMGYGETVPLINQHDQHAWTANRRVEFHILKRAGEILPH
jgi:OOP family OmpA-OmpF porin